MATGLALIAAGLGYYWWQEQAAPPAPIPVAAAPVVPPAVSPPTETPPAIQHPLEPVEQPLPALDASDAALAEKLAELVGLARWQALFLPDRIVRRIVASVDNLPRKDAPVSMWPLKPAKDWLVTTGEGETLAIAPANAARYDAYAVLVRHIDVAVLAAFYRRYYPLFQQAYEELGFPGAYFNDRLVAALDDLLATPEPARPPLLEQRKVRYRFADPDLENRSAGQKILLRIGVAHARAVKARLRELRAAVAVTAPASPAGN
jgi:hypothetical protein